MYLQITGIGDQPDCKLFWRYALLLLKKREEDAPTQPILGGVDIPTFELWTYGAVLRRQALQ